MLGVDIVFLLYLQDFLLQLIVNLLDDFAQLLELRDAHIRLGGSRTICIYRLLLAALLKLLDELLNIIQVLLST